MIRWSPSFVFARRPAAGWTERMRGRITCFLLVVIGALGGCRTAPTGERPVDLPTQVLAAATIGPAAVSTTPVWTSLPATWTPIPPEFLTSTPFAALAITARPSDEPLPTATPLPSATPSPTGTPPPTPTPTETATPTATSTLAPVVAGRNLLPNPSFEEGWDHPNGEPELQIPNRWRLEFDEGTNSLDPDPWNRWVRPEVRVLNPDFLPPQEHRLFIWDGRQTVKVFKGQGAISFRLLTEVELEPGTYLFTARLFPDLVEAYDGGGGKIWASDQLSGEVSLWTGPLRQPWQLPQFGRRNTYQQPFTVDQAGSLTIGVAVRGRWAILNNGWFFDDWELLRQP